MNQPQTESGRLVFYPLIPLAICALMAISVDAFTQSPSVVRSREVFPVSRSDRSRRVFVRSTSLLVSAAVVEDKLLKQPEFSQLGLVITRDPYEADLILELRHDVLTKYVFTVVDAKTRTVIAGGKLSSLGGTVAGKLAKRFVKDIARVDSP
jgi:hypothetical protein